ncbi:MAG: hypothetical protein JOY59_00105 [Candidatus Eremiobacteraeota bacterium]|nr:hypothetical protein [Candidatus Eremiobacteraeota bacterium]
MRTSAAAWCILMLAPAAAAAQNTSSSTTLGPRWVCRSADSANAQNVTATIAGAPVALSCRPINVTLTMSSGRTVTIGNPQGDASASVTMKSPQYAGGMTVSGLQDQWIEMMKSSLGIANVPPGGTVSVGPRYVCRPADNAFPQNGSMTGSSQALACRAVNFSMQTSTGQTIVVGTPQPAEQAATAGAARPDTISVPGPNLSGALTPEQLNDRWVTTTYQLFGNPNSGGP